MCQVARGGRRHGEGWLRIRRIVRDVYYHLALANWLACIMPCIRPSPAAGMRV